MREENTECVFNSFGRPYEDGDDILCQFVKVILIQWNLSETTTSFIRSMACDLFSNVF